MRFNTARERRLRGDQIEVSRIYNGYENIDRHFFSLLSVYVNIYCIVYLAKSIKSAKNTLTQLPDASGIDTFLITRKHHDIYIIK